MSKSRKVNKKSVVVAEKNPERDSGSPIMASSFGSEEFSKAYDECASGQFADHYRSYGLDCEHEIPHGIIKDRSQHFNSIIKLDEIAKKVVKKPVVDALSNWRDSNYDWEEALGIDITVQRACQFARFYGCSVVLPILKNSEGKIIPQNRPLESVLSTESGVFVDKIIFSKENLKFEGEIETDFYKPWYGYPKKIRVGDRVVHPSRVAFFGDILDTFFIAIKGDLADYHESRRRLAIAVRRNTGIILKSDFSKIAAFLTAKKEVGASAPTLEEITTARARSLYQNINDVNAAVINQEEEVTFYEQTNIDDLIKNVENSMQILTATSDMPLSQLFGKLQSTGMSNGGATEFLNYNQSLDSWRVEFANTGLAQLDHIMSRVTGEKIKKWKWNETKAEELWKMVNEQASKSTAEKQGES